MKFGRPEHHHASLWWEHGGLAVLQGAHPRGIRGITPKSSKHQVPFLMEEPSSGQQLQNVPPQASQELRLIAPRGEELEGGAF